MAAHYGIDPLRYLALEQDDMRVVTEVLKVMAKDEAERNQALIEAVASHTASLTAKSIVGWLARNPIQVYWKSR